MHRDLESVKTDNRFIVDWYLDGDFFRTIEQLLRSTKPIDENERLDSNLTELTDSYVQSEEERIERNLKSVGYNIDSPATVGLITGPGRIEGVSAADSSAKNQAHSTIACLSASLSCFASSRADPQSCLSTRLA
jgi:hypothetical protein